MKAWELVSSNFKENNHFEGLKFHIIACETRFIVNPSIIHVIYVNKQYD
jgi:hypothetical protein